MVDRSMLPPIDDNEKATKVYEELTEKQEHIFFIEKVIDWNKRIAHYPQAKKNIYLRAFKERERVMQILAEDSKEHAWEASVSNKKYGMECEVKFLNDLPWMRAWVQLDCDVLTGLRFCGNMDNRLKYERNLSVGKIIDTLGVNLGLCYQRTYRIVTVAPRDVYVYVFSDVLPDGRIILILFTDPDDEKPEEPGCVRMDAYGGMLFIPDKNEPNKCQLQLLQTLDIKGVVPRYIVMQVMKLSAFGLTTIADSLPKWIEQNKQVLDENPLIEQQNDLDDYED